MRPQYVTLSYVVAAIAAGSLLPRLEHRILPHEAAGIAVSSIQGFLAATSSGMMALTGIVFSLALVMVQFSGSAYSPRLVSLLLRDPAIFHALGAFAATFLYALATLLWIDRGNEGYVPLYSSAAVLLLLVLSMLLLLQLVIRIGYLRIAHVLRMVGDCGRRILEDLPLLSSPGNAITGTVEPSRARSAMPAVVAYSGVPMNVIGIDVPAIVQLAEAAEVQVRLTVAAGDSLSSGMPLFYVYGGTAIAHAELLRTLTLAPERSLTSDLRYAFRLLVDIAIRALSPAVNDPTTAVQSLDQIEDLLIRLGARRLDAGFACDGKGSIRLRYPAATWEDYLALSFDEIRVCGSSQIQIMRRLRAALNALQSTLPSGPRSEAVARYCRHLDAGVDASPLDTIDRAFANEEDRQGIGVSR